MILFSGKLFTQTSVSINGVIREAFSLQALSGAKLIFTNEANKTWESASDSLGKFSIQNIEPGRFNIHISLNRYQTENITGYLIGRTKGELIFELHLNTTDLPELVVSERKSGAYVNPLSNILVVTREETEKLPAGFFDPARLFTNQAGVTSMNDGANHLVVRGNNPAFTKWMINGTEIVNPNHLSNAGTFNDQASTSGGGVNMISATVLDNTYLHKGPYDATLGNALAGALDLNLRKGNTDELKTEAQISLLGLEIGLQGPLSKKGASFITRYRYSTVGLLADFGAKFGDENINYQDFMANLSFPSANRDLSFFVFTGNNVNDYTGKQDSTLRTIDKERYNIRFNGGQLIAGMSLESRLNKRNRFQTDIIYSNLNNKRFNELIDFNDPGFESKNFQGKWSIHPRWISVYGYNKVWTTGFQLQVNRDKTSYNVVSPNLEARGDIKYLTSQPYTNLLIESGKWSVQAGLHGMISKSDVSIEPRVELRYQMQSNKSILLSLGKYSQLPSPITYFKSLDYRLMKSWQGQINYDVIFNKHTWSTAAFYQHHFDIPTNRFNQSFMNEPEGFLPYYFQSSKGNVYGIETSYSGTMGKWSHQHNVSVFTSDYFINQDINGTTRFDQRFLFHNNIGREWSGNKARSKKIIGLFAGIHYSGALKDSPVDNSNPSLAYSIKRPDIFRLDLRIYRRKFYQHMNTLLALDIQNLTNQQNFSYSYFDTIKQAINFQYQLGVLPNLSYTIEF